MELKDRLKLARKNAGMTQAQVELASLLAVFYCQNKSKYK